MTPCALISTSVVAGKCAVCHAELQREAHHVRGSLYCGSHCPDHGIQAEPLEGPVATVEGEQVGLFGEKDGKYPE